MSDDVSQALTEVDRLHTKLRQAYEARDARAADRLIAELGAAERGRNRAVQRALSNDRAAYRASLPVRDQVIRVLTLIGRPVAVSLLRDIAAARYGDVIPGPKLASLRRDEQRSYRSPRGGRPVYVAPGLTFDRFAPVRAVLALSSWPLELRLLAPTSSRVDTLHAIGALAAELESTPDARWAGDVEQLLWRLAGTIPDATDSGRLSPDAVRAAAEVELAAIAEADTEVRQAAAERARGQLGDEQQLFGAS